ncbi:hypothetical protein BH23ACT6_BH23ACT6_14700 [soil metagenome]
MLMIGLAQPDVTIQLVLTAMGLLAIAGIVMAYRRLTGLWVDASNLGPAGRRYHRGYVVIVLVCLAAALIPLQTMWLGVAAAAVAFVATVVMGRHLDELLREEIRDGTATLP